MDDRPKTRWTPEELALMARFERDNPDVTFINEAIHKDVLPHRTIEGIKGKRRPTAYKNLIQQDEGRTAVKNSPPASPPRLLLALPSPEVRRPGLRPMRLRQRVRTPSPEEPPQELDQAPDVVAPEPSGDVTFFLVDELVRLSELLGVKVPEDIASIQIRLDEWTPPRPASSRPAARALR